MSYPRYTALASDLVDGDILTGMPLLYGSRLTIDMLTDGRVRIELIEHEGGRSLSA